MLKNRTNRGWFGLACAGAAALVALSLPSAAQALPEFTLLITERVNGAITGQGYLPDNGSVTING